MSSYDNWLQEPYQQQCDNEDRHRHMVESRTDEAYNTLLESAEELNEEPDFFNVHEKLDPERFAEEHKEEYAKHLVEHSFKKYGGLDGWDWILKKVRVL